MYSYGFNGMEKDDEVKGSGNHYDLGLRNYDPRTGRMFSIDPRAPEYSWQSPYVYHRNNPVTLVDYLGGGDNPEDSEASSGTNNDLDVSTDDSPPYSQPESSIAPQDNLVPPSDLLLRVEHGIGNGSSGVYQSDFSIPNIIVYGPPGTKPATEDDFDPDKKWVTGDKEFLEELQRINGLKKGNNDPNKGSRDKAFDAADDDGFHKERSKNKPAITKSNSHQIQKASTQSTKQKTDSKPDTALIHYNNHPYYGKIWMQVIINDNDTFEIKDVDKYIIAD